MGELHVNMNITLDGVIQANGGPTRSGRPSTGSPSTSPPVARRN